MNREEVERIIAEARSRGERPDLSGLDLTGADLTGAILRWATLRGATLRGADLTGAILAGAILDGARGVLHLPTGLLSGPVTLTTAGFSVGCWDGDGPDDLRALIAGDDWPQAVGEERELRRPGLLAVCDLADAWLAEQTKRGAR